MEKHSEILDKIGRKSGMTVPDGYFADFISRMPEQLPQRQWKLEPAPRRTTWSRIRPYAYMAAMFAGIWCMMKMFSMAGGSGVDLSNFDNHPALVSALQDDSFVNDYVYGRVDEYDMMDELYETGLTPEEIFASDDYE